MFHNVLYGAVLFFCSLSVALTKCPPSYIIAPCTCSQESNELPDLACYGISSVRSLSDIFANKFPTDQFRQIVITESQLGLLPNDVFKGKSFRDIQFSSNRKTSFKDKAIFSSSQSTLTRLSIVQETDKWQFNADNVANFNQLNYLEISGDEMELTGTLNNPALESLVLRSFTMTKIPKLGKLPALLSFDMDGDAIASLSAESFVSMPKLMNLYLGHNKLVSLDVHSLELPNSIIKVDLSGNIIATVQKDWMTGFSSNTSLQLVNNNINRLPREIFQPLVENLAEMLIDGNPLDCGCDIAWLITNPSLLNVVHDAHCLNGTRITNLDAAYFRNNC